jgi:alpha-mannosidase
MEARFVAESPAEARRSFVACDAPGMVLEAVKWAEDGDGLVVRMTERSGGLARGRLGFGLAVRQAWATNLMEERERELAVADGRVAFEARPYEIVTVRVNFWARGAGVTSGVWRGGRFG